MNAGHLIGALLVLLLITLVGLTSGRQIRSAADFSGGGRRAGSGIVAGAIIGTLVGGSSTIGTAQLAFNYGFSALWFTLGGGLGCLILAVCFSGPMYNSGAVTLPQMLRAEFGQKAATTATLLTAIGSFLSIVSQLLSGMALIRSVSSLSGGWAVFLTAALMLFYVVFGGVWGAGKVGIVKTLLLALGIGSCGVLSVADMGGFTAYADALPKEQYFSLFARGIPTDLGAGISLIVGVITTQTYIQAIISAKSLRIAKTGAFLSAVIIPLLGIAGIYVGLNMKLNYPEIDSATALPRFILEKLPALPAGVILAALLVALVGTGAGLSLGISSMLCRDIYKARLKPDATDRQQLIFTRTVIAGVLLLACLLSGGGTGSLIMSWSFLSMGLRGAVAFFPLCAALFFPGRVQSRYALASMVVGPVAVILSKFLIHGIDPLFPGMAAALITLLMGCAVERKNEHSTHGFQE